MIQSYGFGKMVVEGKRYSADLIIYPDRVESSWWRKEGHRLDTDDLADVFEAKPEVIVVGTGYLGMMRIPEETKNAVAEMGIELVAEKTGDAWRSFNELSGKRKTVGAFHLTC